MWHFCDFIMKIIKRFDSIAFNAQIVCATILHFRVCVRAYFKAVGVREKCLKFVMLCCCTITVTAYSRAIFLCVVPLVRLMLDYNYIPILMQSNTDRNYTDVGSFLLYFSNIELVHLYRPYRFSFVQTWIGMFDSRGNQIFTEFPLNFTISYIWIIWLLNSCYVRMFVI